MGSFLPCGRESSDKPTDVTNLTAKDIKRIRKTWKEIDRKNLMIPIGAELFVTLFETYPYMMDYFDTFKLLDSPAQHNQRLGKHALTFMRGINLYVDYIDAPEVLVGLLQKVALNHLERDVSSQDMEHMAEIFIQTLKSQLGAILTEEAEEAWAKLFFFINAVYKAVELQVRGIHEMRSTRAIASQMIVMSETSIV